MLTELLPLVADTRLEAHVVVSIRGPWGSDQDPREGLGVAGQSLGPREVFCRFETVLSISCSLAWACWDCVFVQVK